MLGFTLGIHSPPPPPAIGIDTLRLSDLVGRQEIADVLAVSVATVDTWRRRYADFPDPCLILSGTPIWRRGEILHWAHTTPRHRGRPAIRGTQNGPTSPVPARLGAAIRPPGQKP
jgi:predicted DNA-binding transcriptional regulator AlpA